MNEELQTPFQRACLRIHSYIERAEQFVKRQFDKLDSTTAFFKAELNRR